MQLVTLDREQHRATLQASLGDGFVQNCVDAMPRRQVLCGQAAKDAAGLAACSRP